jgi:hypothetical protein
MKLASLAAAFAAVAAFGSPAMAQTPPAPPSPLKQAGHTPPHVAPRSALPRARPMARAAAGLAQSYGGTKIEVTTYHYDNYRTGWNPTETDLTPTSVGSGNFGLLTTLNVDGNVFAQPLLVSNFTMPDQSVHDVLIVATGHNSVYAFDAQTYAVLWQVNLGPSQSSNDVGCGDIVPEYGITSTPVIVRSGAGAATLYVVSAIEPSPGVFQSWLHALNLGNGQEALTPTQIAPTGTFNNRAHTPIAFDPQNQYNRASLAYAGGQIYMGIGSHCDNNAYSISGWMLDYDTSLTLQHAFHTIETPHGYELSSIWMSGFAPAIDPAGNVFAVTGNGGYAPAGEDYGESVIKLSPTLTDPPLGRFTPAAPGVLNNGDLDFGSGGVMLLPPVTGQAAPALAVAMGKSAILYLLDQDSLVGFPKAMRGPHQTLTLGSSGSGLWGGPAYFAGPAGPTVFAQINGDVLRSYRVATGAKPALNAGPTGNSGAGYGGSIPIVSSNGATAGTGVVWLIRRSDPVEIEAYNADSLGAPIFSANIGVWSNESQGNPFLTPMEANGRVYAPGYLTVSVFGLTP